MTELNEQTHNPLHGLKLDQLLTELVDHYGWEILAEYTNINCFKNKPTLESSLKFLRKTEWAREKLEAFYLYKFKSLPKPDDENYALPPRKRMIALHIKPWPPQVLVAGEAPPPKERTHHPKDASSKHRKTSTRNPSNNTNNDQQDDAWDPWGLNK